MKATFTLQLSGDQPEVYDLVGRLGDLLTEQGYYFDEDYTALYGAEWAIVGVQFRTLDSLQAAIKLLPTLGVLTIPSTRDESIPFDKWES